MKGRMRLLPILCLSAVSVYSAHPFHAGAQGPLTVQEARLSEQLVAAILPGVQQAASEPASVAMSSSLPLKAGVYLYQEGNYGEVEREVLTLRKPWWLGSSQMNDVVTRRRNVRLNHPHSRLQLSPGAELLLVLPEGASPAEYRLLRLDGKKDRREFRVHFRWRELKQTPSGLPYPEIVIRPEPDPEDTEETTDTDQDQDDCYIDVPCTSDVIFLGLGGMDKSTVRFDAQEVAPRAYKIRWPPLRKGEYGFFPPSDAVGQSDVIDLGNLTPEYLRALSGSEIYTFGIK